MRRQIECLESRNLLSATALDAPMPIASAPLDAPRTVEIVDIDGDGLRDLLLGTYQGSHWMRQTPLGFSTQGRVTAADELATGDLNGDGAVDLVELGSREVIVHLNNGQGEFMVREQEMNLRMRRGGSSLQLVDMDADGDLDLTMIAEDREADFQGAGWMANDGQGNFGPFQPLVPIGDVFLGIYSDLAVGDVDADGDMDLAVFDRQRRSSDAPSFRWYERTGDGYQVRVVEGAARGGRDTSIELVDASGNGRLNLVVRTEHDQTGQPVVLVFELDSATNRFVRASEFALLEPATQLVFVDLDRDGDQDVVRARGMQIDWFPRGADGQLGLGQVLATHTQTIDGLAVADVDGDAWPDIVIVSQAFDTVISYLNQADGSFLRRSLASSALDAIEQVMIVDWNGDQKNDLLTRGRHLSWLPAADGLGQFAPAIDLLDVPAQAIAVFDADGDGDPDVASTDGTQLWMSLNDGSGAVTTSVLGRAGSVLAAVDWDGDGDTDLVTNNADYSDEGAMLWWYEYTDRGVFSDRQLLIDLNDHAVFAGTWDEFRFDRTITSLQPVQVHDSRMKLAILAEQRTSDLYGIVVIGADAAGAAVSSPPIVQFRQDDMWLTFAVADTDADGYDEIVSRIRGDDWTQHGWFELHEDGPVERPFEQLLASVDVGDLQDIRILADNGDWLSLLPLRSWGVTNGLQERFFASRVYPMGIDVGDLNGDGQLDLVGAEDSNLYWLENVTQQRDWNGDQQLNAADIDLLAAAIRDDGPADPFDLDGDGSVLAADLHVLVRQQLSLPIADVNLDGRFNSTDLVLLFQAGKYETQTDALWSEGDFNGDGRFNSADIVIAWREGYMDYSLDDD